MWAEEQLRQHSGRIKADTLKRLVLLATGDAKAAQDAWCKRVQEEMRQGDFSATGE